MRSGNIVSVHMQRREKMCLSFGFSIFHLLCSVILLSTQSRASDSSFDNSSSWAKLQISPNTFCSMPYGNIRVNIYEHSDNKVISAKQHHQKYYYAPITLLDHESAVSTYNNVTQRPEMRFRVEMWNEKVENDVIAYLSDFVGETIKSSQVQLLPLEKVVLANTIPSPVYSISTKWLPYQLNKHQWFSLSCFEQKDCDLLAANMRSYPAQFEHLKLLFSLSSQTSQTKQSTIRLENIASGQMVAKLLQKFETEKEVLLTAADEKRLLTETTTNVIVETFDDTDVVSSTSELQIYNMLRSMLVASRLTLSKETDKMWNSVFWNEDNYRPDKISKEMNDVFKKLDKESQEKMSNSFNSHKQINIEGKASFLGIISGKLSSKYNSSKSGASSKEDIEKFYQEAKDHVEWDGDKFVPKPMSLSRINLGKFRDSQSLQNRNVKVRYTTAVLSTPINFVYHNLTVLDQLHNVHLIVESLKLQLADAMANMTELKTELYNRTQLQEDIGRMPLSCADLQRMGQSVSGFYSIKINRRMGNVYCNFRKNHTESGFQTFIGYSDVKSTPVYFYAQKNQNFVAANTPIPFESMRVNIGGAMDMRAGMFTAPRAGRYFFSFSALVRPKGGDIHLALRLNGNNVGSTYGDTNHEMISLSSLLELRTNDKVCVVISGRNRANAELHDNHSHYTHFSGWLVEEDIW